MLVLIIQTVLLLAIAFVVGCVLGSLLRRWLGSSKVETPQTALEETTETGTTTGAAATLAAKRAAAPTAPIIPKPPMPAAPARPVAAVAPKPKTPPKPSTRPKAKAAAKSAAKKSGAAPSASNKDNLKLIRGIGPQNEARLNELGIFQFAQVAEWKAKDEAHYGEVMAFPGRIEREEWVKQAKVLAKGKTTEFSERAKSGDVSSSTGKAKSDDVGKKPAALAAARGGKADNLTAIDGVGSAIEKKMFKFGIFHFDQIAKMNKSELAWLGNAVGFPGRPERENWAGEAKRLAAGGSAAPAKRTERGQIKTARKS